MTAPDERPAEVSDIGNPADLARLSEPMPAFKDLGGLVVPDEIQRRPKLCPVLRVLADQPGSSESLAGRIACYEPGGSRLMRSRPTG